MTSRVWLAKIKKDTYFITTKLIKINYETIKNLDEYDSEESNCTVEKENNHGCRMKDETSIEEIDLNEMENLLNVNYLSLFRV